MKWFLLYCVGAFALQWVLLTLTRRRFRPLRWVLPGLTALLVLLAPICLSGPGEFMGPQIAALFCAVLAAALAVGWAPSWALFALWTRRQTGGA